MSVLYISYDGMLEPLGQSQVLGYLERLVKNQPIHLISFEKPEDWADINERKRVAARIAKAGIHWHPLSYHKRPSALATAWDITCGIVVGLWLVIRHRLRIVHARSYVPSVIALGLKRLTGVKYLFDMRGFWADERVDGGLWPRNGRLYSVAKWFEQRFLLNADHIISLTQAALWQMQNFPYLQNRMPTVTVIPTCADLVHFRPSLNKHDKRNFVLGYVGSAGTWYLFDQVAACFAKLRELQPDAKLLILNRGQHSYILDSLARAGIPSTSFELKMATHDEVPAEMSRMNAGIFFYKPSFSRAACAPTKLGEFLGCGIPCLSNIGVGDMAEVLEDNQVGVVLGTFDDTALTDALQKLLKLVADSETEARCVATAHQYFSLDQGVTRYTTVYEQLMSNS